MKIETNADPAEIRRQLDEILAQPEFRRVRIKPPEKVESEAPEWLQRFFEWLGELFGGMGSALSGLGLLYQVLAYAVLAVICGLIVWLLVKAFLRYQRQLDAQRQRTATFEEGDADIPPGDLPADVYLTRAADFAARRLYREAIGQLILGAMSYTERGGLIRFRRGLTHRDYLRALRERGIQQQAFRTLVLVYEPICFGRRPALPEHYHTSLDGYQSGFLETSW